MTKDGAYCFNWKEKKSPASLRYSSECNDAIWVALVYVRQAYITGSAPQSACYF